MKKILSIFLVMLIIGNVQNNDRYLVIVRAQSKAADEIRNLIDRHFDGKARFRVENSTIDTVEEIYEVSQKVLNNSKKKSPESITDKLYKIEGVHSVNLVCQNDEINR